GDTAGSIIFVGSDLTYAEDNSNLFWNNTLNRLGIGTDNPSAALDVVGDTELNGDLTITGDLQGSTATFSGAIEAFSIGTSFLGTEDNNFLISMLDGGIRINQIANTPNTNPILTVSAL